MKVIKTTTMRWAGYVTCMGEMRNAYNILVGKPEGKKPLRRYRHTWKDVKIDLRRRGWEFLDWIHLAQDSD
jgi:hypothetical protein